MSKAATLAAALQGFENIAPESRREFYNGIMKKHDRERSRHTGRVDVLGARRL